MNLPTIRVSPSNLPKFSFLLYGNYLSEYKTEIDKARVRYNLGIPDSLSFKWGNIGGSIENQIDVINLVRQSIDNKIFPISESLTALTSKVNTIADNILTINNDRSAIQIANQLYKDELDRRLLELEREISLNASLIKLINNDGATVDLSTITSQLLSHSNSISLLQNSINNLLSEITRLQSLVGVTTLQSISVNRNDIEATTASDKANITIIATFSTGNTRDVTSECTVESSNTNVAIWNNGIQFIGVGTAIITYTYTYEGITKTVTTNVLVKSSENDGIIQYVGYAVDPSYVLGIPRFGTNTIAKTWTPNNTAIEQAPIMGFWVCTTQNILTFSGSIGEYNLLDLYVEQRTYNGITYKIYMAGPVSEATTFNITI